MGAAVNHDLQAKQQSDEERDQLLRAWNDTAIDVPPELRVHHFFEQQADRTPDAPAARFGDHSLSYRELDEQANRLAHVLRGLGVGPDVLVGIHLERSCKLAVALLAILKAGGAYVPLDPAYPRDRLAFVCSDTQVPVILTQRSLAGSLPTQGTTLLELDDELPPRAGHEQRPAVELRADHLAYVIYTSGSTGRPKGICLPHLALVNLIRWHQRTLLRGARTLQFASLSFDASFHEMFAAWSSGGCIYFIPESTRKDVHALTHFIHQAGLQKVILPVVVLQQMAEQHGHEPELFSSLRELTTTGEQLHITQPIVRLFKQLPDCLFHNHYGPSETHVVTALTLSRDPDTWPTHPSIGKPIDNTTIHILDAALRPVAIGDIGELYIGGFSLGRCYLGRPDLTAERFVRDPFSPQPDARLYKTGDLARYLPDGNIEFLGRIDHQVKIRGFRIELGEIESTLSRHPAVQEAVVLAREDTPGDKRLVAYLVVKPGWTALAGTLRSFLGQQLPDYMLPAAFVFLDAMPLTANGKIDRRALPRPGRARPQLASPLTAPRTATEDTLAAIFGETLQLDSLGVHDSFFELGGDSISAVKIVARIHRVIAVDLSIEDLFSHPTVAKLAERVERAPAVGRSASVIPQVSREQALPLSFAQERMWFLQQLAPSSPLYNCCYAFRLQGPVDVAALTASLRQLVQRHEVLRTTFPTVAGQPFQRIAAEGSCELERLDLRPLPANEKAAVHTQVLSAIALQPFDLSRGPLCRVGLIALEPDQHTLWFNLHHIVTDARSMAVLFQELTTLYHAARRGETAPLSAQPLQYADFASWDRQRLSETAQAEHVRFWQDKLGGWPSQVELPTDHPRKPTGSVRSASAPFAWDSDLSDALRMLGASHHATLSMVLLAGLASLVHRYTGEERFLLGIPSLGRDHVETESAVGFFINLLPIRIDFRGQPSFASLLEQIRGEVLAAFAHDALPFELLVQHLRIQRSAGHGPLVQVALAPQPLDERELHLDGLRVERIEQQAGRSDFDLTVFLWDEARGCNGTFDYNADLFERTTIDRMQRHLRGLLSAALAAPDQPVAQLPLLDPAERDQLLVAWSGAPVAATETRCFHELFRERAQAHPDDLAVAEAGPTARALSYAELDRRSNQLARYLQEHGAQPDTRIGLCTDRGLESIVGILGILKSGGAYVPLDPDYPRDRLAYMIEDAAPVLLLTQAHLVPRLPSADRPLLRLDADWADVARHSDQPPQRQVLPQQLAYVIYTSGSTGRPKGVMIEQRNLSSLAMAQRAALQIQRGDRVLQFSSLSFDASVWEISAALTAGATLCLLPPGPPVLGIELGRLLLTQRIDVATLTPSVLQQIPPGIAPDLRTLIVAGEACTAELVRSWAPRRRFINAYGPTEVTVCATAADCAPTAEAPPIGRPIANAAVYVCDPHGSLVPVGVPGELYIGGAGVARGYLNQPELTQARFVRDPFAADATARLYRTGDRVRWRADGSLEFLGRLDQQVKVNGFRVELGEIEIALREHPQIKDVAVLAQGDDVGGRRLIAYCVPADASAAICVPGSGAALQLRAFLEARLPRHLVPSLFIALPALPLSPTGKLDRSALPVSSSVIADSVDSTTQTAIERLLTRLWCESLGVQSIGPHDNFFESGGHSLLAARIILRIQDLLSLDIPLRALYEAPTIAGLARLIEQVQSHDGLHSLCYTPTLELAQEARLDDAVTAVDQPSPTAGPPQEVFVTGVSGYVGAFLLAELLQKLPTAYFHCLVRAHSDEAGLARLRRNLERYGLWAGAYTARIHPVLGDLAQERLGLTPDAFDRLAGQIDAIYHSGAQVDHVRSYEVLKPSNVLGTHEVLRLACHRRVKPLHFLSTLSVLYPPSYRAAGVASEADVAGPLSLLPNGYMQSKCVAEHLVLQAMARGVPCAIYRLGAIAGDSRTGACNSGDIFYSALRTSAALGIADDLDTDQTMVPVDHAARVLVAVSLRKSALGQVFHICPRETFTWLDMIRSLRQYGYRIAIRSYSECMDLLREVARQGSSVPMVTFLPFLTQRHPGQSRYILESYYAMIRYDSTNLCAALQEAGEDPLPSPRDLVRLYFDHLRRTGLLPPSTERAAAVSQAATV